MAFHLALMSLKRVGDLPCQPLVWSLLLVWPRLFCIPGWKTFPRCPTWPVVWSICRHSLLHPMSQQSWICCSCCSWSGLSRLKSIIWAYGIRSILLSFVLAAATKASPSSSWCIWHGKLLPRPMRCMVCLCHTRAHATISIASSSALARGVSLCDLCCGRLVFSTHFSQAL